MRRVWLNESAFSQKQRQSWVVRPHREALSAILSMSLLLLLRVLGFGVACCSTLAEQEDNAFAVSQREHGPTARPLNGVWWADKWEAKKVLYARAPGGTRRQASRERVRTMPLASAGMLLPSPH